ncbi:Nucleoside-diphosphate-sugar epimerase [Salinihabitans flavidus]|uniref:Nucleoside-diphosphate-sugar epimerase n=1 Tax=Salinihabitans flavidus TaxID=569882 RepID=A0A1H8V0Q4_9RHOB|nr:NAD-dependent epimerase/dehydratase family protein [Salinihabitans flavidus]SEP09006.1 Nucleoside-diphosphate-sugar epimerase [Salinihabitans flavidus]
MGATGRVGRLLSRAWAGAAGQGVAPLWQGRRPCPGQDRLALDPLADPEGLVRAAGGMGAILVLAGVTPATAAHPGDYRANTELALAAIAAAERAGVPRVFLASSVAVYGAPGQGGMLREDGPAEPVSDYGRAKLEMEDAAQAASRTAGVIALRIGNVAGADQLLGPGRRDVRLDIFPDGTAPRRSYIGPGTLARVLSDLLHHPGPLPECLNLSAPGAVSMADLLRAAGMPVRARPAPAGLIPAVELDVSRLAGLVPLAPGDGSPEAIVRDWDTLTGGQAI